MFYQWALLQHMTLSFYEFMNVKFRLSFILEETVIYHFLIIFTKRKQYEAHAVTSEASSEY